jgi:hypothetical protein
MKQTSILVLEQICHVQKQKDRKRAGTKSQSIKLGTIENEKNAKKGNTDLRGNVHVFAHVGAARNDIDQLAKKKRKKDGNNERKRKEKIQYEIY